MICNFSAQNVKTKDKQTPPLYLAYSFSIGPISVYIYIYSPIFNLWMNYPLLFSPPPPPPPPPEDWISFVSLPSGFRIQVLDHSKQTTLDWTAEFQHTEIVSASGSSPDSSPDSSPGSSPYSSSSASSSALREREFMQIFLWKLRVPPLHHKCTLCNSFLSIFVFNTHQFFCYLFAIFFFWSATLDDYSVWFRWLNRVGGARWHHSRRHPNHNASPSSESNQIWLAHRIGRCLLSAITHRLCNFRRILGNIR